MQDNKSEACTDFLFAQPSFLSGAARVLDLGGTFDGYNRSESEGIADYRAIQMDWRVVGRDIAVALVSASIEEEQAA